MQTTLELMMQHYDRAGQLLAHESMTEDERAEFAAIQDALDGLWRERRAELTFAVAGPPRLVGGGDEKDQKRAIAHGIAPLPGGA